MFKYTNAFTNRSGDSLPGYFAKLYDSGGNLVAIFADASGTPISTVSGVANAALSDENGMFRWYVANGTYDIRFYDANDVLISVEAGVPMFEASGVYTDLSGSTGATLVGTTSGTVQAALTARPTSATLAASGGAALVGKVGGGSVQDFINNEKLNTLTIPKTTGTGLGVIYQDGVRLFHTFNDGTVVAGHVGGNAFGGLGSGNFTLSGVDNTGFGQSTLANLTSASLSTMFGTRAGSAVTSGGVNSGFGVDALATCTTGEYNDGFGCKALTNTTTGSRNKAFGQSALLFNTTGNDNDAVGQEALIANLTGSRNNALGNYSQYTSTDKSDNCSFGTNSLRNNNANENCSFGNASLFFNTTGTLLCSFGFQSLYNNTTGSQNASFGPYSLYGNVSGSFNAALGHRAGYGAAGDEATSVDTYCTFLGPFASRSGAVPTATVLTNSTAVGNDAKVTESNQVVLGNASVTKVSTFGDLYIDGTKVLGAQGAAVADATDAASVITQLNALLARCRAHGLIA